MKKLSLLGIWLLLLTLLLTACGADMVRPPDDAQGTEPAVRQTQDNGTAQETNAPQDKDGPRNTDEPRNTEASREDEANDRLPVYGGYYYDLSSVVLYLETYGELPDNYITKSEARELGWEGGSVENYREGAAIGGDYFGNREGLLPEAAGRSYTECDIDTNGYGSRGSRRLVFSNDGLYFYTSDHYESFSEVIVTESREVTIT